MIAVVGSPNSGKTTLYNWLTASRYKTVNYPGATVEIAIGSAAPHLIEDLGLPTNFKFVDTPGTYSLQAKSADEEVTLRCLTEGTKQGPVTGVLVVVDGTQLERQLFLVEQVRRTGLSYAVVVTMSDLLKKQNLTLDSAALSQILEAPVLMFDGLLAGGLLEIAKTAQNLPESKATRHIDADTNEIRAKAAHYAELALRKTADTKAALHRIQSRTHKIDHVLMHPFWGLICFVLLMGTLFSSIFWLAAPAMDFVDGLFTSMGDFTRESMGEGVLTDFVVDGVITGFASILVFVPQIFILFFGIAILEGSGYLARAATLIDKPFSWVGLSGRSFVPVLSGFACAIPALIATRNISSKRDRWITNFIVPLMTCSARIPVYVLLLAFLFKDAPAWKPGLAMAGLYFASLFVGAFAAAILNRILPPEKTAFLMMELPLYRRPRGRVVLRQSLTRTWNYAKRAGPLIFIIAGIMWFGTNFPQHHDLSASEQIEQSYAGRLGHYLEPAVAPMGVDWRVGVGLISAFAAREVFVSTLAVTFNITDEDESTQQANLLSSMETATNSAGQLIFTPASVAGLIVFFMIALQCMTTFAVAQRESGSWKFAVSQLVIFNLVAYGAAVLVYQIVSKIS